MAYEQGYVGDPRGRETAVADEGAADIGSDFLDSSFAESSSGMTLNKQKVENKLSFYLDEDQFGATYLGSPYNANINIKKAFALWGNENTVEARKCLVPYLNTPKVLIVYLSTWLMPYTFFKKLNFPTINKLLKVIG